MLLVCGTELIIKDNESNLLFSVDGFLYLNRLFCIFVNYFRNEIVIGVGLINRKNINLILLDF